MSGYRKEPVFVHHGTWDERSRAHPAAAWLENVIKEVVDQKHCIVSNNADYYAPDFEYVKPDGTIIAGMENACAAVADTYAVYASYRHVPSLLVVWETERGWDIFGKATIFGNLPGQPVADEIKVKDADGEGWDVATPAACHFTIIKLGDGPDDIRVRKSEIFADGTPILTLLAKRGLVDL